MQSELKALFEKGFFQSVIDLAQREEIKPATDPQAANIVAASLFQLGRYPDCLLACSLAPSLNGDPSFSSMHGAVLRRVGRLDEAEKLFRAALKTAPNNPFLRNTFCESVDRSTVF